MKPADNVLRIDTDEVRVTEWRFTAGATTGHHRHDYDYVVVPLTAGMLRILSADGEATAALAPGAAYFRKAGVEHEVINGGDQPLAFVEIELKDRPG
jgi:quercetin dioxygenase-like cupin family protein